MRLCLPVLLLLCCAQAMAQRTLIRGKATDDKNNPLPGVSIMVKDTRNGVATNEDGVFSIYVADPKTTILRATMTGYETKEMALNGKTTIQFLLMPSPINLKNVVIAGAMGLNRQAKSIGYATQSVNPNNLTEARDLNIVNGLAGKVAGLQVTTTGQPGSSSRLILRGENSMTQNNQPLWVVDGVPINNDMGDGRDNLDFGNGAADINPDDVESIQILQGPNAAALYGSRAANGAVLIVTKKGRIGDDLGIAINQNTLVNSIAEFPAYQNVYGEGANGYTVGNGNNIVAGTDAVRMGLNGSTWGMPMLGQPYDDFSGKRVEGGFLPQPGNITSLYKPSITNSSGISINKADEQSSFRLSYMFTNSDDVLKNQNIIKKHNVSLNAGRKLGKFLNVEARVMYTNQGTKNRTYRNLDPSSPMAAYVYMPRSVNINSLSPWADPFGNSVTFGAVGSVENPLWMLYENENEDKSNRLLAGITATAKLTSHLNFRIMASSDIKIASYYQYRELGGLRTPNGFYSNSNQNNQMWDYQAMFMYNNKLSKSFSLTANLGAEYVNNSNQFRGASIASLLVHDMPSIQNSTAFPAATESLVRSNVQSIYGNATLAFRDFLFIDITGRNDWSSTLPVNNSSFFYPSVSGSFVFSNFLPENSFLNYGKLRASVAQVGNAAPPLSLYTTYPYGGLFLGNPYLNYGNGNQLNNPELKPEKTLSREAGVELALFKSRIQFTANVYQSNTTNQIIRPQIPTETGFSTRILNAGEMQNKGVELSLNAVALQTKKLRWNVMANWSMNRNKVISLVPNIDRLSLGTNLGATVNAIVGQQYGVLTGNAPYKVRDTLIVNPSNGRTIADPNVVLGNFHPDWIGSLGSALKYGPFDLSVLFTVKWGGVIYSASYGRANFAGNTIASLYGRDEFLLSNVILGENDQERMGIGQANSKGNTVYGDADRPKGARYQEAYFPLVDASGKNILDKDGRMIPGKKSGIWMNPTTYNSDMVLNNTPAITFNASNIRLSELIFGYALPAKILRTTPVRSARLAFVGRNLWTLFKHTPQGIDPEAANTTGNAQGIESGGSFPFSIYGFDLKVTF